MRYLGDGFPRMGKFRAGCLVLILAGLLGGAGHPALGQQRVIRPEDFQRGTQPLKPENRAEPARLPERKIDVADGNTLLIDSLVGVRFVRTQEDVEKAPEEPGITFKGVALLDSAEFRAIIQPRLGKPVTMRTISEMVRDTIVYYRSKDRPVVDVFAPEQEITKGVVQLMVVEAHVGEVKVTGIKWFSLDRIRREIHLQPGDTIEASQLLADIDYVNRNPFRFVRPVLEPGKEFGTTDVTIEGKDRFPARAYAGYENTGSRDTGLDRFFAGFNLGNVFDLGHEMGYQYTTNREFNSLGIHSAYWRIPLPNRDTLAFYGNYAEYETHSGDSELGSINWMLHGRYIAPLPTPSRQTFEHSVEGGLDFRRADNNLQQGGTTVYDDYIDVAQFAFQYGGRSKDRTGDTSFVFNAYWSPVEDLLSDHQDRDRYEAVRSGSSPRYVYGHASVERLWILPKDWTLFNRFTGQISDSRLPPTEQLGLGGYNTVRGFDEREVNSDNGLMSTVELRTPTIDLGIVDKSKNLPSYLQFLGFVDYGYSRNRGHGPFESQSENILSVGPGLRVRISDNVQLRLDYGFKIMDVKGNSPSNSGRCHIFLLFSF